MLQNKKKNRENQLSETPEHLKKNVYKYKVLAPKGSTIAYFISLDNYIF